ncbi:MAG TPA: hypothetical protein VMY41_12610 [Thermohalobaculum sp.]|nr:hypothetical protein [Thermohalobaculum sp.]
MTRRVGFNDAQTDWRRSDRETVWETAPDSTDHAAPASAGFRWVVIAFLTFWLTGWTAGIGFAFNALLSVWPDDLAGGGFLIIWLIFAVSGWVFVVRAIIGLLRGKPLPAPD